MNEKLMKDLSKQLEEVLNQHGWEAMMKVIEDEIQTAYNMACDPAFDNGYDIGYEDGFADGLSFEDDMIEQDNCVNNSGTKLLS